MPEDGAQTGRGITRALFGTLPDGSAVEAITLASAHGMSVTILTYGATIQAVLVPDEQGVLADVALGHAGLEPYLAQPQYFGATVGRVANRIAGGRFVLDGISCQVPLNDGPNSLHGGLRGFDKANWDVLEIFDKPGPGVLLAHVSPDGDEGYPGTLRVTCRYALADDNGLSIEYRAEADCPTIVNISNHAYWNLAGEGAAGGAMDHRLTIFADHFLPTDSNAIPTGEIRPVDGTPFDFRSPAVVADRVRDARDLQICHGRGFDHTWVVARDVAQDVHLMARVEHPGSGRVLELLSNQPGLQFYSGNFLDATSSGKAGRLYRMGDAIVLEPQMFPDTPNRREFGSIRLDPGQTYRNHILFRFRTVETK